MASKHVVEVTEANFETEVLKADKLVLIDFYATWCGPCKGLAPILEQFAEENKDTVKVVKIDVDANPKLAEAFQIRAMPTLVTMKDGQGIYGVQGAMPKSALEKFAADSLQKANENNMMNKKPDNKGPEL